MNYVNVDGTRLAYQLDGPADAPPLVFVNSLGTDLGVWAAQVADVSPRLRVIRYDMRGHGYSVSSNASGTLAQLGQDLIALLDHLGIARAHVCGLSLGGMVALWLAVHNPARVTRAVFANTAARIGSVESWSARIEAVQRGGMAAVRDTVIARFLSAGFCARNPDVAGQLGAMLEATDPAGYIAACAALRDADLRSLVPVIRVPSLIVAGELDQATPPAQSDELHAAIVGSELLVLPQAGHLSNIEQPAAFNAGLLRFLANP